MSSSFEKSVKGGTKVKMAAPKSKYVEHILLATRSGEAGVAEIFRTMSLRLRDTTWTIVFKALIIVHLMIKEGEQDVTLRFLSESPSKLAISSFSDVQTQGVNIRNYHNYILSRAKAYRDTQTDWVRSGKARLKQLSVDKGLLRECESVQKQINALLKCNMFAEESENEISLTAFRQLVMDLLVLYHIMNEGTINLLEHYFEMSKVDAERALAVYKTFSRQTEEVVRYLSTARQYENATRLEIPKLKHAPTSLTQSLEEYLHDPDFDINRRQYLAQQEAKRTGRPVRDIIKESSNGTKGNIPNGTTSSNQASTAPVMAKGPAPDLMDFFGSIEQNQQPLNTFPPAQTNQYSFQQQPVSQNNQFSQPGQMNSTNPFAQMMQQPSQQMSQSYTQQPFAQQQNQFDPRQLTSIPQDQQAIFQQQPQQTFSPTNNQQSFGQTQQQPFGQTQQPFNQSQLMSTSTGQSQSTNPFRQSTLPSIGSDSPFKSAAPVPQQPAGQQPLQHQSTNPFARSTTTDAPNQNSPFTSAPPSSTPFFPQPPQQTQSPPQPTGLQPMAAQRTGTNPFARSAPPSTFQPPTASPLAPQTTGTNPFRQTAFINQQTGLGWQAGQGTMGGLENLDTLPVFPRPGGAFQSGQTGQAQGGGWP